MSQEIEISIGVKKVRLKAFFMGESEYKPANDDKLKYGFQYRIDADVEKNLFGFTIRIFYFYSETDPELQTILDCHVTTTFFIQNLQGFTQKNEERNEMSYNFTNKLWVVIASLSLTHLRAIMSTKVAGTAYDNFIVPIVNPEEFTNRLLNFQEQILETDQII